MGKITYLAIYSQLKTLFEIHLTVTLPDDTSIQSFEALCRELDAKPLVIELARGQHTRQPMLSKTIATNGLTASIEYANNMAEKLVTAGYAVTRTKIEIPADDAVLPPPAEFEPYFEWHGKIEYTNVAKLLGLCTEHKAHLSLNALKNETGYRFITLREFGSKQVFELRIAGLLAALQLGGWTTGKQQREYCLYDNHTALDAGWLTA